jgi:hypothetical protein
MKMSIGHMSYLKMGTFADADAGEQLLSSSSSLGDSGEEVNRNSRSRDQEGEQERGHAENGLGAGCIEGIEGERDGAQAQEDRNPIGAGDAEGAGKIRLVAAEENQGDELEDHRHAPENEINCDEPFEGKA